VTSSPSLPVVIYSEQALADLERIADLLLDADPAAASETMPAHHRDGHQPRLPVAPRALT